MNKSITMMIQISEIDSRIHFHNLLCVDDS